MEETKLPSRRWAETTSTSEDESGSHEYAGSERSFGRLSGGFTPSTGSASKNKQRARTFGRGIKKHFKVKNCGSVGSWTSETSREYEFNRSPLTALESIVEMRNSMEEAGQLKEQECIYKSRRLAPTDP